MEYATEKPGSGEMVTVKLVRSYVYKGVHYGPFESGPVPKGLADALYLRPVDESAEAKSESEAGKTESGQALPSIRALREQVGSFPADHVKKLKALDPRTSAQPIYDRRLAELGEAGSTEPANVPVVEDNAGHTEGAE